MAIIGIALMARARSSSRNTGPAIRYETTAVDRGTIAAKVTASGTLSALVTVQVGTQVSGRVRDLLVDYNSHVTRGQVIARLDPLLFEAAVEQARANVRAAESNLRKAGAQATDAEKQFARVRSLADRNLVASSDLDTTHSNFDVARAQVDAAKSNVDQARAALHQAQLNLDYTTIVSPIDGVVVSKNVDVGQTVASAFQAPTLFVIAKDLRKMQVDSSVGEADVGKLATGMKATFTVDAYPGEHFSGRVRQIRNAAQTVQNVVTYDAVIDVDNDALKLKPGMTATITFVVAEKRDVLRVANAALRFQPDPAILHALHVALAGPVHENHKNVWTLRAGAPRAVPILPGVSDGSLTEVTEGDLRAGDIAITDMAAAPKKRFGVF